MTTAKQSKAARTNIREAQTAWQAMSPAARARAQPQGRDRARPGSTGEGAYYHVELRPKADFTTFRTQDVGNRGGIERVAGKRSSGSWDTMKWLIGKEHAHVQDGRLVADTQEAREVLDSLGSEPMHLSGDRFKAAPRPNVPERDKPTPAQKKARQKNILKAQAARQVRHH